MTEPTTTVVLAALSTAGLFALPVFVPQAAELPWQVITNGSPAALMFMAFYVVLKHLKERSVDERAHVEMVTKQFADTVERVTQRNDETVEKVLQLVRDHETK